MDTEYDTPDIERRSAVEVVATNADRGAQVTQTNVESNRLVPTLVAVACMGMVCSGLALGVALWARDEADQARMEARLLQVKVEGFEKALWAAQIDPNPHLKGQPE